MKVYRTAKQTDLKTPYLYSCSHLLTESGIYERMMHVHKDIVEIILIVKGSGFYLVDGKKYHVKENDLIIFDSYVAHEEHLSQETDLETICCALKNIYYKAEQVSLLPANVNPVFSLDEHYETIHTFMKLILLMFQTNKQEEIQSVSQSLINYIKLNLVANAKHLSEESLLIQKAKEYIELNYFEDINLELLADLTNLSSFYLSRQFKKEFHCSPVKYLIKRRIGEAQTLLQNTDKTVSSIANEVGFNNISHFQSTFKKMVGWTPIEYRERYRKDNQKIN